MEQQYLLEREHHSKEREHHSKILAQLAETRRELGIVRSELKNNSSTDNSEFRKIERIGSPK